MRTWSWVIVVLVAGAALPVPDAASGQTQFRRPVGSVWVTPYLGLGDQSRYYDDVVRFSDGDIDFLRLDPGAALVYGVKVGFRFRPAWTLQAGVTASSPSAEYLEDLRLRPDVDLNTTQVEAGALYDLGSLPLANRPALIQLGGGISLTRHALKRFSWDGVPIEPRSTSLGAHGLAVLDVPLTARVSLHGESKLTVTRLALSDVEDKIALAEGDGETVTLEGTSVTIFAIVVGLSFRL